MTKMTTITFESVGKNWKKIHKIASSGWSGWFRIAVLEYSFRFPRFLITTRTIYLLLCVCTNRVQSWRSSYIMEYNPNQYVWKAIYMCRWCANYLLIRTEELCDQLLRRVHFFLIDFWCSLTIYFDFGCQYIILWNRISFSIFPLIRKPTLRLHLYSLCFIRHVLWETTHNKFTEMSYKSQRYSWARRN